MIPVPPNAPDILPTPEPAVPTRRGGEAVPPLVLQAFDEIDELRRTIAGLRTRLEALENRLAGFGPLEQRVAALESGS